MFVPTIYIEYSNDNRRVEDSEKKLSYDLFYLRNFSFWLDLLIMLKTIKMVLNIKGSTPRK